MSSAPARTSVVESQSLRGGRRPSRPWAFLAALVVVSLLGTIAFGAYYFAFVFELFECMSFFGGSGPPEHLVGGATESLPGAASLGVALGVVAGAIGWRLRAGKDFVILVVCFALAYGAALVVLGALSPVVWGPERCEPY